MGKNQHKKDLINLAEAYGSVNEVFGGEHVPMMGMVPAAQYAPEESEEHDKTGHLSDEDIVAKAKGMGTASSWLIDAAEKHLHAGGSLTPRERDDFARDVEGHAEKDIAHDKKEDEEGSRPFDPKTRSGPDEAYMELD